MNRTIAEILLEKVMYTEPSHVEISRITFVITDLRRRHRFNRICMKFLLRMNSYRVYSQKREPSTDTLRARSIFIQRTSLTKVLIATILHQSRWGGRASRYIYISQRYIFKPGNMWVDILLYFREYQHVQIEYCTNRIA